MSSFDQQPAQTGVPLTVTTADPATEIFVLDARFHLVTRGIGLLQKELRPGLYVVRARSGSETREEVVLLQRDAPAPVIASFPPISFGSPAPLADTGKTHENHIALAREVSTQAQVRSGTGSSIFVCAREWSGRGNSNPRPDPESPIRGLSLRTLDGNTIADLESVAVQRLDIADPCAACTIEVDPGAYRLVLDAAPGLTVEQVIVATPGWQTQVFLLQHEYAEGPEWRRADLVGASILMAYGMGFVENREEQRLAEMARLALRDGRRVLSDNLRLLLHGKFSDPMLGIFAAHLLLRDPEIDENLYRVVVENLRVLLGPHPDVDALARRLQDGPAPAFLVPPMLRRSWELILTATVAHPEIVPPDSPLAGIAPRIWGEGPWLIWMERSEADQANDLAQIARSLSTLAGGELAQAAQGQVIPNLEGVMDDAEVSFGALNDDADVRSADPLDEATVSRLVQNLGVPRSMIEQMMR